MHAGNTQDDAEEGDPRYSDEINWYAVATEVKWALFHFLAFPQ